jgi:hypothetical protein
MRKVDTIELIAVVVCLLFAIAISLYHLSYEGYLGLSESSWGTVWAISENGFSLSLVTMIGIGVYLSEVIRKIFKFVFIPYFILKLIYHYSCYSGKILLPEDSWRNVWSVALVWLLAGTFLICLLSIRKSYG